jgi:hypothetical protein
MRTLLGDQIESLLRTRTGVENATSAAAIATALGYQRSAERVIRETIEDEAMLWARSPAPLLICALPGRGYFAAASLDEALAHPSWLLDIQRAAQMKPARFARLCQEFGFPLRGLEQMENAPEKKEAA